MIVVQGKIQRTSCCCVSPLKYFSTTFLHRSYFGNILFQASFPDSRGLVVSQLQQKNHVKNFLRRHGIQCTNWKTTGRGTPWDAKPPSRSPRPLPSWIAQLLQDESAVVGVDAGRRPLPFASALKVSGVDTWEERCVFWEERAHFWM